MRTLSFVICCLIMTGAVWADSPVPAEDSSPSANISVESPDPRNPLITLDLTQYPLKDAIDTLFRGVVVSYKFAEGETLNAPPYSTTLIDMHVTNVPFDQALKALLKQARLVYRRVGGIYEIYAKRELAGPGLATTPDLATSPGSTTSEMITMKLPPMAVRDAVAKIDPGWQFDGNLGDIRMPGASFYKFPKDMSVGMVLIAAGLVPPTGDSKVVTSRGTADLSSLYQWIPPQADGVNKQNDDGSGMSGMSGSSGGFGRYSGGYGGGYGAPAASCVTPVIAVGAYKSQSGVWLFTVLSSQSPDIDLLQMLFAVSGKSYVMGDISTREYYTTVLVSAGNGALVKNRARNTRGPSKLSVQIYDATLDQALGNITSAAGLKFRKTGTTNNPTYVIDTTMITDAPATDPQPAPASTRKTAPGAKSSGTAAPGTSGGVVGNRSGF